MDAPARSRRRHIASLPGMAQLSLVEHALCPLDMQQSLAEGSSHQYEYFYLDKSRNMAKARAEVACPWGLSPNDELYLWGLLHLTFSQPDPQPQFVATPHYCLRQLGIVDKHSDQQKRYDTFRQAVRRLSGVAYRNDRFFDPIRGEHRDVAFGLLKYSLPLDPASSRAWRFFWDQQFFDFCSAIRGSFQFDLDRYRELDFATRRLYLLLKKLFWRRTSIRIDARHLAVNTLGFSASIPVADLKIKLRRCLEKLLDQGFLALPPGVETATELFVKRGKGRYAVTCIRGPQFDEANSTGRTARLGDSPLYDPLSSIGFTDQAIQRILNKYKSALIQEWADITLAAHDRGIITKDPQAFFRYYAERAANRQATPPDWWYELRRKEERKRWQEAQSAAPTVANAMSTTKSFDEAFEEYLQGQAKDVFAEINQRLFGDFQRAGKADHEARRASERFAKEHLRQRFLAEHPEYRPDESE